MAVSLATIRTDVYTTVYNHLQTGTYALSTNNIYPAYNRLSNLQDNYPQVIVSAPLVSMEDLTFGADKTYECPVSVLIEVMHNSSANAKSMADEVNKQLLQGRSVLRDAGMHNIKFEPDDFEQVDYSAVQSTHIIRINFTAKFRGAA